MFALQTLTLFDPDCASPKNGILVNLSAFALPQILEPLFPAPISTLHC